MHTIDQQAETTGTAGPQGPEPPPGHAASIALVVATVLSGLFAGFFATYSASVQLGLAEVDDLTYVQTFQAINATIRNPAFAVVFFGCVPAIALAAFLHRNERTPARGLLIAGGLACAAVVVITFAANVPLNDELASYVDPTAETARLARADFESTWNSWNLARSVLSVGGAIAIASAWPLRRVDRTAR